MYLFELGVGPAADPLGDVVDVGAGGAGEAEAVGALLDLQDVGARRAEHQHDGAHMWPPAALQVFMRTAHLRRAQNVFMGNAAPNLKPKLGIGIKFITTAIDP